ncbi:GAF domain-containing protein [Thermosporothrix hazakensis]|jgi:signal transduction histidine kinase|uniref:histidine kinase n=1 Tax=Thermosporothrix hazakensis TaxID=644383 RepID=A0A326UAS9_THEHA|nr:HAMP domain-containing sensor histidine kinase [Thermosporothrix hazakensis]PZW32942.1 GAF domain-containing protein [Thermosporothrix hazakensis]GCE48974.1 hypothetical protein KTH_38430 [Thermosporothrix hazakensis]
MLNHRRFAGIVYSVQALLNCSDTSLILACHDATLRHPLLQRLPFYLHQELSFFSVTHTEYLLHDSRIQSLCDIALQTGHIWYYRHTQRDAMLAAPLERPQGLLGVLLCSRKEPFTPGDFRLLQQTLPRFSQDVERSLEELSSSLFLSEQSSIQDQYEFLSLVCHELRRPLTTIKGYTGLLQSCDEAIESARRQRYLQAILTAIQHLEAAMNDLFDISCLTSGRFTLHCQWIDLVSLCTELIEQEQERIEEARPGCYTLRLHVETPLPPIWADPHRVRQILANILDNAIKYSPQGGLIEMLLQQQAIPKQPPRINITVRDHGIGITPRQQRTLFQPFSRLHHPATSQVSGLGLGLYLSRKLAEAMQGQLVLQSVEGKGTNVTLQLPIAPTARQNDLPSSTTCEIRHSLL